MARTNEINNESDSLSMPTTSSTVGQIKINATRFAHAFGTNNTFIGSGSGNFTLTPATASNNTAVGEGSLIALTSGNLNTAFGTDAGKGITTGTFNNVIGHAAGQSITQGTGNNCQGYTAGNGITTGVNNTAIGMQALPQGAANCSYCTAIGYQAGINQTGTTASSNIYIMNGGVNNEANKIRIGTQGTGNGQQNTCFIAGIQNTSLVGSPVVVTATGQLGVGNEIGSYVVETGATATLVPKQGSIANRGTLLTFTLPATAAIGDTIQVIGMGAGGWQINQNANQTIHFTAATSTTVGVGGSVASTDQYDAIKIICSVANLEFIRVSMSGNCTIV